MGSPYGIAGGISEPAHSTAHLHRQHLALELPAMARFLLDESNASLLGVRAMSGGSASPLRGWTGRLHGSMPLS